MKPYWIKTEAGLGVGITAASEGDARMLFASVFGEQREIRDIQPIEDASELDEGHVRPNMGNWLLRGVWFPQGLEPSR